MPRSIKCGICGARSPRRGFEGRMAWIRRHYSRRHPRKWREDIERGARKRAARRHGLASELVRGY